MKIGTIAYSTDTGLGTQTWEFTKHIPCHKILMVDLSQYNHMPTHRERFPTARICRGFPSIADIDWLTHDVDLLFFAETPLVYNIYAQARQRGVLIIQQPNPEFLDYYRRPELPKPHVLALPTPWRQEEIAAMNIAHTEHLPVPINLNLLPLRTIASIRTVAHIAGRPAHEDRNGTLDFLTFAKKYRNEYKYILYIQPPNDAKAIANYIPIQKMLTQCPHVQVYTNVTHYSDMYAHADVIMIPRRYGGLCLPAQESIGAGIPVVMPHISPNDALLPQDLLYPATLSHTFTHHSTTDVYASNPDDIAAALSRLSSNLAELLAAIAAKRQSMSWNALQSLYLQKFEAWKNKLL